MNQKEVPVMQIAEELVKSSTKLAKEKDILRWWPSVGERAPLQCIVVDIPPYNWTESLP